MFLSVFPIQRSQWGCVQGWRPKGSPSWEMGGYLPGSWCLGACCVRGMRCFKFRVARAAGFVSWLFPAEECGGRGPSIRPSWLLAASCPIPKVYSACFPPDYLYSCASRGVLFGGSVVHNRKHREDGVCFKAGMRARGRGRALGPLWSRFAWWQPHVHAHTQTAPALVSRM